MIKVYRENENIVVENAAILDMPERHTDRILIPISSPSLGSRIRRAVAQVSVSGTETIMFPHMSVGLALPAVRETNQPNIFALMTYNGTVLAAGTSRDYMLRLNVTNYNTPCRRSHHHDG